MGSGLEKSQVNDKYTSNCEVFGKNFTARNNCTAFTISGPACIVEHAQRSGLMSYEHFNVDGTLIEGWVSLKSFKPKNL